MLTCTCKNTMRLRHEPLLRCHGSKTIAPDSISLAFIACDHHAPQLHGQICTTTNVYVRMCIYFDRCVWTLLLLTLLTSS